MRTWKWCALTVSELGMHCVFGREALRSSCTPAMNGDDSESESLLSGAPTCAKRSLGDLIAPTSTRALFDVASCH